MAIDSSCQLRRAWITLRRALGGHRLDAVWPPSSRRGRTRSKTLRARHELSLSPTMLVPTFAALMAIATNGDEASM